MGTDFNGIEFIRAERIGSYLKGTIATRGNPVLGRKVLGGLLGTIVQSTADALETLIGRRLYIKRSPSLFDRIPRHFHKLINRLATGGVLRNCYHPRVIPNWPRIALVSMQTPKGIIVSGRELNYELATIKAIAELLERHSLSVYHAQDFLVGKWLEYRDLGAVNPGRFSCFSESQLRSPEYSNHRIEPETPFQWVNGRSFLTGSECLVPAQLVYLDFQLIAGEPYIRQTTTNGAAAGSSREMATYYAICEAIERDAFMIHWLNKIAPPRLEEESVRGLESRNINFLLDEYQKHNIDLTLFDITTDIEVPVIMAVIRDKSEGRPVVQVTSRADFNVVAAIEKALTEAVLAGTWPNTNPEQVETVNRQLPSIRGLRERHLYWCDPAHAGEAAFLFTGPVKKISAGSNPPALHVKLARLKPILQKHQLDAYLVDVTAPIARECGITVVMALIPELCPLYLNEHFRYLGLPRLYAAPVAMGIFAAPKNETEMNSTPHPML